MQILQLFVKEKPHVPVRPHDRLILHKGYGIDGDVNAHVGSPRQVLIVDKKMLDHFGLQPGDLHENILIDSDGEQITSGQLLQIGDVLIRPTFRCEPCAKLNGLRQGLATQIKDRRGFLGMVVKGGTLQPGAEIVPTSHQLPTLPDDAKGRFYEFVSRIPAGKVVRTSDLILAIGVGKAYYRAIPALLKKAGANLPAHRIVAIDGSLFIRHLPAQAERLAVEGITLTTDKVPFPYYWQAENFHAAP